MRLERLIICESGCFRNCKVLILICTSSLLISSNSNSEYFLDIVHTMGINSAYEPFDYKMSRCGIDESKCLGGISRIAGFVYNYRRDHGKIILLDGGNFRSKNVWYDTHSDKAATAFLNHMKYDAMVNRHELSLLKVWLLMAIISIVANNIVATN